MGFLKKLIEALKYKQETYHLALVMIDSIFSLCNVEKNDRNLILITCIIMAGKMYETDSKVPFIDQVLNFFKNSFTREKF